jgi:hypothetical protein
MMDIVDEWRLSCTVAHFSAISLLIVGEPSRFASFMHTIIHREGRLLGNSQLLWAKLEWSELIMKCHSDLRDKYTEFF